jgi:hypothetical protein
MKLLSVFLLLFLAACTTQKVAPVPAGAVLRIAEVGPNKWTAITRQNLEHLLGVYNLTPLIFTDYVEIQSRAFPHSHPSLTLNTRYAEQPQKLLAAFMHEQLHWWSAKNKVAIKRATKDLRKIFPKLPQRITYEHLVICFLEYDGLIYYLGKTDADKVFKSFITQDKLHPWSYQNVMARYKQMNRIILKYKLKPAPFNQNPTKNPPLS